MKSVNCYPLLYFLIAFYQLASPSGSKSVGPLVSMAFYIATNLVPKSNIVPCLSDFNLRGLLLQYFLPNASHAVGKKMFGSHVGVMCLGLRFTYSGKHLPLHTYCGGFGEASLSFASEDDKQRNCGTT